MLRGLLEFMKTIKVDISLSVNCLKLKNYYRIMSQIGMNDNMKKTDGH